MNSSAELSSNYFHVLRHTSKGAYKLYSELGDGDLALGYDTCRNRIAKLSYKISELHCLIKAHRELRVGNVSEYIWKNNADHFTSRASVAGKVWRRLYYADGFPCYKSLESLTLAEKSILEYLDKLGVDLEYELEGIWK